MLTSLQLPDRDYVQEHINISIAFYAIERDSLVVNQRESKETKKRLKALNFMIDELAIRTLERGSEYSC